MADQEAIAEAALTADRERRAEERRTERSGHRDSSKMRPCPCCSKAAYRYTPVCLECGYYSAWHLGLFMLNASVGLLAISLFVAIGGWLLAYIFLAMVMG